MVTGSSVRASLLVSTWNHELQATRPSGSNVALHYEAGRPPVLAVRIQELFGLSETSVLKLQAAGVAISPSLLATVPYLFAIVVVVLAQSQGRRSAAMPADLTAIFRTR